MQDEDFQYSNKPPDVHGVHDAAHAHVARRASQLSHVILAVHKTVTEQQVPVSIPNWCSKQIERVVRISVAAETISMATCMEQLDLSRTQWSQITTAGFSLQDYEGAVEKQLALVTDCEGLHDGIHKERAAPSSTYKRHAIELAIHCQVTSCGRRSRLEVDRRTLTDCRLSHQARIEKV